MNLKGLEISVIKGDITEVDVEAIVNAANTHLEMGGGVALAIKKKGGSVIEKEAVKKGPISVGEAVISCAGNLKAKYVIHAATMTLNFKTDEDIIRKAAYSALLCAQEHKVSSLAFCALGCGVGKFPYEASAKIMAQEVFRYIQKIKNPSLKRIVFVLYSQDAYSAFKNNVERYLDYMFKKISSGPFLTVDGIVEYEDGIVMIERRNPPFGWALPGGFVDYGEAAEDAVIREIKEETSLDFKNIKQFHTYSKPDRDVRFHTVSIVFVGKGEGKLKASDDAKSAAIFRKDNLPSKIAFDHRRIIEDYFSGI